MDDFIEVAKELRTRKTFLQEEYYTYIDCIEANKHKDDWKTLLYETSGTKEMVWSTSYLPFFEFCYGAEKARLNYLIWFFDLFNNIELPTFEQAIIFFYKGEVIYLFKCSNEIKLYSYNNK